MVMVTSQMGMKIFSLLFSTALRTVLSVKLGGRAYLQSSISI